MSLFSREPETPEFRNDEKKDVRQIKADLNSMIETGEIQELTYNTEPLIYEGTRFWYVVAYFVADGAREEPTMIYLDPMTAYLSQFRYEKTEGTSGDWVLANDANRFVFDENWRLLSWSDDHYSTDYTYSDNGIDLNITNKESGLAESVRFDY